MILIFIVTVRTQDGGLYLVRCSRLQLSCIFLQSTIWCHALTWRLGTHLTWKFNYVLYNSSWVSLRLLHHDNFVHTKLVKSSFIQNVPVILERLGKWRFVRFFILPAVVVRGTILYKRPFLSSEDTGLPPWRPGFEPWSGHVGFVVNKAARGQVSPSASLSPANAFHRLLLTYFYPSSSGAGTIG
jgi:hypothetical protein